MGNPAPPAASYALLSALTGYANGQVLTQAELDAIGNLVLRGDGQGNFAEIKTLRVGPTGFVCNDAQNGVWLAQNAYTDDGVNWYAFNSALGSYAIQFTVNGIALNYAPATASAIAWLPFAAFSDIAYDNADPTEQQIYALQQAISALQSQANNGGFKPLSGGPANAATTTALAANTYNNGTAGVGATLTANANGALSAIDGQTLTAGARVWVQNEASAAHNGLYVVTQLGSGSAPYILTRATDANTPAQLGYGYALVLAGTVWAGYGIGVAMASAALTIGTTAIVPIAFSGSAAVAAEATRAQAVEATLSTDFATVAAAANVFDNTNRWLYGKLVTLAAVDASYRKGWVVTSDGYFYAKFAVGTGVANGLSWAYNPATGFHQISLGSTDGLLPIGSSSGAYIDATGDRYYKGKNVIWSVADPVYRSSIIVTADGEVYIPKLQSASFGQIQGLDTASYLFQTQPVGSLTEIFRYSKATGLPTQATSSGNNVNPILSADGANIIYATDRSGVSQLYFQPVGGGNENPVISLSGLIALGDSRSTPGQEIYLRFRRFTRRVTRTKAKASAASVPTRSRRDLAPRRSIMW